MKRKDFLIYSGILSASMGSAVAGISSTIQAQANKSQKLLNAYYFRAHMYTLVPHQIKEDLKWMADRGTDAVSVAILEQDLYAAVENVEIITEEAHKLGMKVFAVPSRWGGMFAGAPKVPSIYTSTHPNTWMLNEDGQPFFSPFGPVSSVHYPGVYDFFCESAAKMFNIWDIDGLVWDEPKSYRKDFSEGAKNNLGNNPDFSDHIQAVCDFHSKVNNYIKSKYPDKTISMFNKANEDDMVIDKSVAVEGLDYFGADGRPWYNSDGGQLEGSNKTLLDFGKRHLEAAKKQGVKSLWLLENHNMATEDVTLMEKRMQEFLTNEPDQLIYYYYPRNLKNPSLTMKTVAKYLKNYK